MTAEFYRCLWAQKAVFHLYHDKEWGTPVHDDKIHFEMLILDGAQAGLSWETILRKRDNYRLAFDGFDYEKVAQYDDEKRNWLLNNPGIVRNRLKINSAIRNANVFVEMRREFNSFDKYIWRWVKNKPIDNRIEDARATPAKTELSHKISQDLLARGMNFVGSTIIYAYLQSAGLVNDHETKCFRYAELGGIR